MLSSSSSFRLIDCGLCFVGRPPSTVAQPDRSKATVTWLILLAGFVGYTLYLGMNARAMRNDPSVKILVKVTAQFVRFIRLSSRRTMHQIKCNILCCIYRAIYYSFLVFVGIFSYRVPQNSHPSVERDSATLLHHRWGDDDESNRLHQVAGFGAEPHYFVVAVSSDEFARATPSMQSLILLLLL